MANNTGWIKLHRQIRENPFYRQPIALSVWIECLLRANHSDSRIYLARQVIKIKEGQFVCGRDEFGKSIGVNGTTAWFWLKQLKVDSMIDIKTSNKGSIITVLNWTKYQGDLTAVLTTDAQRVDNKLTHQKNDKKNKNENKSLPVQEEGINSIQVNNKKEFFEYLKPMVGKQPYIKLLAYYVNYQVVPEYNLQIAKDLIRRNVKTCKELWESGVGESRINEVMKWLSGSGWDWTMETVGKYIHKDLSLISKKDK